LTRLGASVSDPTMIANRGDTACIEATLSFERAGLFRGRRAIISTGESSRAAKLSAKEVGSAPISTHTYARGSRGRSRGLDLGETILGARVSRLPPCLISPSVAGREGERIVRDGDGGGDDVVVDRRKSRFREPEDEHARGKRSEKAGLPPPSSRRKAGAIKEPAGPSLGIKHLRHEGT